MQPHLCAQKLYDEAEGHMLVLVKTLEATPAGRKSPELAMAYHMLAICAFHGKRCVPACWTCVATDLLMLLLVD